ncbi:UNVERIFIED_CONTAM: hypothetical protein K2H54_061247 [Gekko kuhli]
MVKATSNPASTVGIDGHVRVVGSRLGRIWIGSWSSVDGARIRHRSASPVGPDVCRLGSPHGQGSQTAVCCKSMGIGTVPSPPVPDGPPVSSKAGTNPMAEPTTPNEASVFESESRFATVRGDRGRLRWLGRFVGLTRLRETSSRYYRTFPQRRRRR